MLDTTKKHGSVSADTPIAFRLSGLAAASVTRSEDARLAAAGWVEMEVAAAVVRARGAGSAEGKGERLAPSGRILKRGKGFGLGYTLRMQR